MSAESHMYRVVGMLREALDKRDVSILYRAVLDSAEGVYGSVAERLVLRSRAVLEAYGRIVSQLAKTVYDVAVVLGLGEGQAGLLSAISRGEYLVAGGCIPVIFKSSIELEGEFYSRGSFSCLSIEKVLSLATVGIVEPVRSGVRLS